MPWSLRGLRTVRIRRRWQLFTGALRGFGHRSRRESFGTRATLDMTIAHATFARPPQLLEEP
jgi:hypothetical protein